MRTIPPLPAALTLLGILTAMPARAADPAAPLPPTRVNISAIFDQMVAVGYPLGFVPLFEKTRGRQHIQESVPEGETARDWSQMFTVTGARGLAANPHSTPARVASVIIAGFRQACPATFSLSPLGERRYGEHDAYATLVSCGRLSLPGGARSETTLLITIRGERDYYTVQWAERGAPSATPPRPDVARWAARERQLLPIHLCARMAGETRPYPICQGEIVEITGAPASANTV